MVFVNDKKYSCEACIKGHRSSSCKHTDRPLFEIKKKGRPVTQCEHCRELRKTKQVHVKCLCQSKPSVPEEKGKKGNLKKVLASAAYPNGLPSSALEGATSNPPEPSSDSDHSNQSHTCGCKDDQDCHCFTLKHHPRRKAAGSDPGPGSLTLTPLPSTRRGSTNLRPVLPKPSQASSSATNDNAPVLAPRPHLSRSTHGSAFFSPYGRAYNEHFTTELPHPANHALDLASLSDQSPSLDLSSASVNLGLPASFPTSPLPDAMQWQSHSLAAPSCSCGDGCACPGCVEHRGASAWFTRECANPGACATCFTCLTGDRPAPPPAPTPPTTPLGARSSQELEQWMMDAITGITPSFFPGFDMLDVQATSPSEPQQQQQQQPPSMNMDILSLPSYCIGICAPGQCTCTPDSNAECQRDPSPFFANLSSAMLPSTFDLDLDMDASSMLSLPDTSSRGRSSSYPSYVEGDLENLRFAVPKASSTTSLLPIFDADNNSNSLMSRVFPGRGPAELGDASQPSPPRASSLHQRQTETPTQTQSQRRTGLQYHLSGAFFEAAARRFG